MKKYTALILAAILFCTLFASCSGKIKGTETVSTLDGDIAVVTDKDGNLSRDKFGNVLVVVTDQNGRAVKGADGKNETSAAQLTHAVAIGNKIEYSLFSVTVPDGWVSGKLHDTVVINSTDEKQSEKIVIYSYKNADASKENQPGEQLFNNIKMSDQIKINKLTKDDLKIAGANAKKERIEVSSDVKEFETKSITYYSFRSDTAVFGAICYSKTGAPDKTFEDVLNTMIFH